MCEDCWGAGFADVDEERDDVGLQKAFTTDGDVCVVEKGIGVLWFLDFSVGFELGHAFFLFGLDG